MQTVTEEASLSESIRSVLKVENSIEGGCAELLDKEQTLIRQGSTYSSQALLVTADAQFIIVRLALALVS